MHEHIVDIKVAVISAAAGGGGFFLLSVNLYDNLVKLAFTVAIAIISGIFGLLAKDIYKLWIQPWVLKLKKK